MERSLDLGLGQPLATTCLRLGIIRGRLGGHSPCLPLADIWNSSPVVGKPPFEPWRHADSEVVIHNGYSLRPKDRTGIHEHT